LGQKTTLENRQQLRTADGILLIIHFFLDGQHIGSMRQPLLKRTSLNYRSEDLRFFIVINKATNAPASSTPQIREALSPVFTP
jgi:hypothetical protein